ncbi:MAG: hypothetical protein GY861_17160 [bacterium]|nr:hypothetical protein [bacterium]
MGEDIEFGRLQKSDKTEVVVKMTEYKGEKGIDIREFLSSERYTGPTKSGTRIPEAKWEEFKAIINKVRI